MSRFPSRYNAEQIALLRKVGNASPFYQLLGIETLDAADGQSRLRLKMADKLLQPALRVHGGALATLCDSAMAMAILPCLPLDREITTVEMKINFLSRMKADVVARARVIHLGNSFAVADAVVEHEDASVGEAPVAHATATFAVRARQ